MKVIHQISHSKRLRESFLFSQNQVFGSLQSSALTIYWCYINLNRAKLSHIYKTCIIYRRCTALFGIFNTGLMGVLMGLVAGVVSDFVFKSSSKLISVALLISAITLSIVVFFKVGMIFSFVLLILFSVTTFLMIKALF